MLYSAKAFPPSKFRLGNKKHVLIYRKQNYKVVFSLVYNKKKIIIIHISYFYKYGCFQH